jgi:hypothetical protein
MEVVDRCFSMNIATKLVGFQKVLSHWVFFVWSMTSHRSPISVKIHAIYQELSCNVSETAECDES